jgi:hypothetical protein
MIDMELAATPAGSETAGICSQTVSPEGAQFPLTKNVPRGLDTYSNLQ